MFAFAVFLVVALHLAFVGYVAFGGFLALRRPRTFWLHLPAVGWAILIATAHLDCPLTGLERTARARVGMAPLPPDGFIAHYLTGVLYPSAWAPGVQAAVLAMVAVSWAWYLREALARRRYRGRYAGADHRRRPERLL